MTTYTAETAQLNMRDILDSATQGEPSLIERDSRPAAVVISYEQWQTIEDLYDTIEGLQAKLELQNGEDDTVSLEELEAMLRVPA